MLRRNRSVSPVRREPTLDMPSRSAAPDRIYAWRAGPSFTCGARPAPRAFASDDGRGLAEPVREGEVDATTDSECHDMARRFAPAPPAADEEPDAGTPRFRLRRAPGYAGLRSDAGPERKPAGAGGPTRRFSPFRPRLPPRSPAAPEGKAGQKPIWPGSVPAPPEEAAPDRPHRRAPGEELYSRAVAIVRADRKATTEYLQQRLGIRYMRAADLIERMEQEGILGAPARNGMRPILRRMPRTRIV